MVGAPACEPALRGGDPAVLEAQVRADGLQQPDWDAAVSGPALALGKELRAGGTGVGATARHFEDIPARRMPAGGANLSGRRHQRPVSHAVLAHIWRRVDLRAALPSMSALLGGCALVEGLPQDRDCSLPQAGSSPACPG